MEGYKRFKQECIACGATSRPITKEHLWPQWLFELTNVHRTGVKWAGGKRVSAASTTVPLCDRCNSAFGSRLEAPVKQIFADLEAGSGISDHGAEILVRWLWKFEGLAWRGRHPEAIYSPRYTLFERVLAPIDDIRGSLVLALALIDRIDASHGDAPVGIDSTCEHSAIFVAGVFSKISMMVLLDRFVDQVPSNFTIHRLAPKDDVAAKAKLIFPRVGFRNDNEAVFATKIASVRLSRLHDEFSLSVDHMAND